MSTHLERHRAEMQRLAYPVVEAFVASHPEYSIAPSQSGSQSVTNYVIFGERGTEAKEQVIFKYFCEDERKDREVYALYHFASTGVVPRLLFESGPRLIVQSYVPGRWIIDQNGSAHNNLDANHIGYTLGLATARLLAVPLSPQAAHEFESTFYDGMPLEAYLGDILSASRHIHQNVHAYAGELFGASLNSIELYVGYILAQPRLLYHQDALNMHSVGSDFAGFFDLEMCRVGTAAMQIGSLWHIFATYNNWLAFAQGFADQSGRQFRERDFQAGQAFAHFLVWRYISRSGRWHGNSIDTSDLGTIEAEATRYASSIELLDRIEWVG